MSNADGEYIPLTEDDQGEGIKDFHEPEESLMEIFAKQFQEMREEKEKVSNESVNVDIIESWEYEMLTSLGNRLDKIETEITGIKQAIGPHVLINGKWVDLTNA
jgi:hypothetical protein